MALEGSAKKTEHAGDKGSGSDKYAKRVDVKQASRKRRRAADKTEAHVCLS